MSWEKELGDAVAEARQSGVRPIEFVKAVWSLWDDDSVEVQRRDNAEFKRMTEAKTT